MNADDARDEALKVLAQRLRSWGVDDPFGKSRAYLDGLTQRGWRWSPGLPTPPRADEACRVCGRHEDRCICEAPTMRPSRRSETSSEHLRSLRGIHAATKADLCTCGVPVQNCNDHKARTDHEQQESA